MTHNLPLGGKLAARAASCRGRRRAPDIVPGGVNVHLSSNNALQVDESVTVSFASLGQVAKTATVLTARPMRALQNYFLSNGGGPVRISPAAFRNDRATASTMARAQGLRLGAALSESEGQSGTACGLGGSCPTVGYQGVIGPDQALEQVTVAFSTTRRAG